MPDCAPVPIENNELSGRAAYIDDELDLSKLFRALWSGKRIIAGVSLLVGIVAWAIMFSMPDIYRSEVLLAPAEESSVAGVSALAGQLGGLASLAGVNLGKNNINKVVVGLEVMKSRSFISKFVSSRGIYASLLAAKKWDRETGNLIYDDDIYDAETQSWKSFNGNVSDARPTDWMAYKIFRSLLKVTQAKDTGLITVSIDHVSPVLAQQWVAWLIDDVNAQMRARDIEEAHRSIDYLKLQLEQTPVAGMQQIFYQLIEKQMQTIMLANVRDQYVFKIIDPPVIPEEKVAPRRALTVALSIIVSFMISALFVLVRHALRQPERK